MLSLWHSLAVAGLLATGRAVPLVVDTDMDVDDMMAIMYLMHDPTFELLGIAVDSDGYTLQPFGVDNALRLINRYGCGDIPVAFGAREGFTMLTNLTPSNLPPLKFLTGIDSYLRDCVPIDPSPYPAYHADGASLLIDAIRGSDEKVNVLALGSLTNLAIALNRDPGIADLIETLYVSGGKFEPIDESRTDQHYPWDYKAHGSSWNIFVDPVAANQVLRRTEFPQVWATSTMQDDLTFNETHINAVAEADLPDEYQFLFDFTVGFKECTHQEWDAIQYWDQGAATLMSELVRGIAPEDTFCTEWDDKDVIVNLIDGPGYANTIESEFGTNVKVCLSADNDAFKADYWSVMIKVDTVCDASAVQFPTTTNVVGDLEAQVESLAAQVQQLQRQMQALMSSSSEGTGSGSSDSMDGGKDKDKDKDHDGFSSGAVIAVLVTLLVLLLISGFFVYRGRREKKSSVPHVQLEETDVLA